MSIKDKLKLYADYKRISPRKFSLSIGASDSFLRSSGSIQSDILPSVRKNYPDLSIDWLLFDEGEMIKSEIERSNLVEEPTEPYMKDYKDKYIEVLEENRELNKEIRALQKRIDSKKKSDQQIFTKP
tara:strand:+ start:2466 stop:2846 length:381 start_codon:yes stop_codon:yes gene_type:complete